MIYAFEATNYPADEGAADTGHLIAVLEEVADTNVEFQPNPDWVQPGDKPVTIQAMLGMADDLTTDGGVPHPEYRDILVQIAAVAVAGIMLWDRQQTGESGEALELADAFGVECGECVVQTVMVGRREQAVADWNRRAPTYDLVAHLERQRAFSEKTFGPGVRTQGVLDHIAKEADEIRQNPTDIEEWADMILLGLDGAWRAGHEPSAIAAAIQGKQTKNENRTWPDWRTADPDKAIEHVKGAAE